MILLGGVILIEIATRAVDKFIGRSAARPVSVFPVSAANAICVGISTPNHQDFEYTEERAEIVIYDGIATPHPNDL